MIRLPGEGGGRTLNRKRILCFLTALMLPLLCGCGSPESIAQAQTPLGLGLFSKKNTAPEPEPEQQQEEVRGPYVAPPFAASAYHAGLAEGTADARIDLSAVAEGYVAVSAVAANRLKFQVVKDDIVYNYDIASNGTPSIFPLQSGNGTYRFRVMENVVDSKYAEIYSATCEVTRIDEFQPFLRPNDYVPYTSDSLCVKKAQELAATAGDELGLVNAVFQFVCANVTYDREKAMAVTSGYMPKPDETMQTGKGICFDYAALAGAMLRSQGIPTKEIFGYVAPDGVYHAWNMFYTESTVWVTVSYEVRADSWNRLEDIPFRLSRYYAEQKTILEKLKNAVTYPAAMLVLTQVFGLSRMQSAQARQLTDAVCLAQNAAEAVAASQSAEENCALPDEGGNARVTEDGVEAGYDLDMAPDSTGTPALLLRIGWEPEGGLARSRIAVYRGGEGGAGLLAGYGGLSRGGERMKQVPIKLGPLTLLLTVISICLTTLAILNFTTARADMRLAEKFAETVQTRYALEAEGQAYLQELDALFAAGKTALEREEADEDGVLWRLLERDSARLHIGVRPAEDGFQVVSWRQDKEWNREETLGNLWPGF